MGLHGIGVRAFLSQLLLARKLCYLLFSAPQCAHLSPSVLEEIVKFQKLFYRRPYLINTVVRAHF